MVRLQIICKAYHVLKLMHKLFLIVFPSETATIPTWLEPFGSTFIQCRAIIVSQTNLLQLVSEHVRLDV